MTTESTSKESEELSAKQLISALIPDHLQEELDNEKRKVKIATSNRMKDSAVFHEGWGKKLKPPILKRSNHSNKDSLAEIVDFIYPICSGQSLIFLCLMIDVLPGRDHVQRHKLILESYSN